jgi:ADP-ribose pyrophosphatase YjhB (NUDIX family)
VEGGKVATIVTRLGAHGVEMCVFDHPAAGTQLPAGTMLAGESASDGARRELVEETGVTDAHLVGELAVVHDAKSSDGRRHVVHFVTAAPWPDEWWVVTPDGGGHCWRCHWLPLAEFARLHERQPTWV